MFPSFLSIDASREDGSLGRLVNDEHRRPNCKMKRIDVNGNPHLCLFALDDIQEGEEITYDYGSEDCPWRTQVCYNTVNIIKIPNSIILLEIYSKSNVSHFFIIAYY